MDDLPPPPQQQVSADPAQEDAAAAAQASGGPGAEAERAAFLAATEGFAFEGPLVVLILHALIMRRLRRALWPLKQTRMSMQLWANML